MIRYAAVVCRNCGARVDAKFPFCMGCGHSRERGKRMYPTYAPAQMRGLDPVTRERTPRSLAKQFREVLDAARTEKPLQLLIEHHPIILLTGVVHPHTAWVFPRKVLPKPEGGSWVPDFMICDWTSVGPLWTIVELESPIARVTNTRGISGACRHAQQQLEDYRNHLRKHATFLRDGGFLGIHGKCPAWIVMGRSEERSVEQRERIASLREYDIEVASYDRLLYDCQERVRNEESSRRWWKKHLPEIKLGKVSRPNNPGSAPPRRKT